MNIGAMPDVVSECGKTLQSNPKETKLRRAATYHTRGIAKVGLSDYKGAIEDFNESIQLNPKKALYYHARGKAKEIDPAFEK